MPVDQQAAPLLEEMKRADVFGAGFDLVAFRGVFEAMVPQMWDASGVALASVEDRTYSGGDGAPMAVRIYTPTGERKKRPVLVFFHGGGFTSGSVNTADPHCRYLAAEADVLVVSADYRLAPEHQHPAGFLDCVAAVDWTRAQCASFGGDLDRLAVGGDAPGATYAAAACLHFRDRGRSPVRFQFLLGPATDWVGTYPEKQQNFAVGPVTKHAVDMIETALFSSPADRADWRISPLRAASHADLPPAFIMVGEYDFLTPEIDAYVETLRSAGVPVTYHCWPGGMHNFFSMHDQLDLARVAMRSAANALRLGINAD